MPTVKEIAEIVGLKIDKEEDFKVEDFKSHLDEKYILIENAPKDEKIKGQVVGKILGSLGTNAAQTFGLKSAEVDGKRLEEVFELVKNRHADEVKALKEAAGKPDKQLEAIQKELEKEKLRALDLEKANTDWESKFNTEIGTRDQKLKSVKLEQKVNAIKSKVNFVDEFATDDLKREGFEAIIAKNYKVDLDEKDELIVTNADGSPVKHPKKSGHFANFQDVLEMVAEEKKLLKKNNAEPATRKVFVKSGEDGQNVDMNRVHPNARKREQQNSQ